MIPATASDLSKMIAEAERQRTEVEEILASLSPDQASWRPNEQKWSVLGHVAHMCIVNEPYLSTMQERLLKARAQELLSEGPYKHPWIGRWFTGQMEPPVKRRWKTSKVMVPDPDLDGAEVGPRFARVQGDLAQLAEDMRGIDLGRARFSSPFVWFVRLSLGTGLSVILGHNRRHIWLVREVLAWEGFPAGAGDA